MSATCPPCSNPPAGSQCCYNAPGYYYPDIEACVNGWYTLTINPTNEQTLWYALYFDQCLATTPFDLTPQSYYWWAILSAFVTVYSTLNNNQIVNANVSNYDIGDSGDYVITQGAVGENFYPVPPVNPYLNQTLIVPTQISFTSTNNELQYGYVKLTNLWIYDSDDQFEYENCTLGEQESNCNYYCLNNGGSTCCYYPTSSENSAVLSAYVSVNDTCGCIAVTNYVVPYLCLTGYYCVVIPPINSTTQFCLSPSMCFTFPNSTLWLPMFFDGVLWTDTNASVQSAILSFILTYWGTAYSTTNYNISNATLSGPYTTASGMNFIPTYVPVGPFSINGNILTYTQPFISSYLLNSNGTLSNAVSDPPIAGGCNVNPVTSNADWAYPAFGLYVFYGNATLTIQ